MRKCAIYLSVIILLSIFNFSSLVILDENPAAVFHRTDELPSHPEIKAPISPTYSVNDSTRERSFDVQDALETTPSLLVSGGTDDSAVKAPCGNKNVFSTMREATIVPEFIRQDVQFLEDGINHYPHPYEYPWWVSAYDASDEGLITFTLLDKCLDGQEWINYIAWNDDIQPPYQEERECYVFIGGDIYSMEYYQTTEVHKWEVTINALSDIYNKLGEGRHLFHYNIVNKMEQTDTYWAGAFRIDETDPTIILDEGNEGGFHPENEPISCAVDAAVSGAQQVMYRWSTDENYNVKDDGLPWSDPYDTTTPDESGLWYLHVYALDWAGNERTTSFVFTIDTTAPVISLDIGSEGGNQANNPISCAVDASLSGVHEVKYRWSTDENFNVKDDGLPWSDPYETFTSDENGLWYLHVYALDWAGNERITYFVFTIDNTIPEISLDEGNEGTCGPYEPISCAIVDSGLGVAVVKVKWTRSYEYDVANFGNPWSDPYDAFTPDESGLWYLMVYAVDGAGNEAIVYFVFTVIADGPTIALDEGTDGCYHIYSALISCAIESPVGVATVKYKWSTDENYDVKSNGDPWSEPYDTGIATSNHNYLHVYASDTFGNEVSTYFTILWDGHAPWFEWNLEEYPLFYYKSGTPVYCTWTDYASGLAPETVKYKWSQDMYFDVKNNGDPFLEPYNTVTPSGNGFTFLLIYCQDKVGNEGISTLDMSVDDEDPGVSLDAGNNGSIYKSGTLISCNVEDYWGYINFSKYHWSRSQYYDVKNNGDLWSGSYNTLTPVGDGLWYLHVYAVDGAGNERTTYYIFTVDDTGPGSWLDEGIDRGTYNSGKAISCAINDDLCAVVTVKYGWDSSQYYDVENNGGSWSEPYDTLTPVGDGIWYLHVYAVDEPGNELVTYFNFTVDDAVPMVTSEVITGNEDALPGYTNTTSVLVTIQTDENFLRMSLSNNGTDWIIINDDYDFDGYEEVSWSITTGTGLKNVYVKLEDRAGNINTTAFQTITLDTIKPSLISLQIDDNSGYTSLTAVNAVLDSTDYSGVASMRFSNDNSTFSAWEDYSTTKLDWNLVTGPGGVDLDGEKILYCQLMDNAGNIAPAELVNSTVLDRENPFVQVNSITLFTGNTTTLIAVNASDASGSPLLMRFSALIDPNVGNDGEWCDWIEYDQTYKERYYLAMAGLPGWVADDGLKSVNIHIKDYAGHGAVDEDTVEFDATNPETGQINIADLTTNSTQGTNDDHVKLWLSSTDVYSGIDQMRINDEDSWEGITWTPYSTVYDWILPESSEGTYAVYVQFRDKANNTITRFNTTILDGTSPVDLTITSSSYANSTDILLGLTAIDVDNGPGTTSGIWQMQFYCDGNTTWSNWYEFNESWLLNIPQGDGDTHIYFRVRDWAGNPSVTLSCQIMVDTQAPVITSATLPSYTALTEIDIENIEANDILKDGDASGIAWICLSNDGSIWSEWYSFSTGMNIVNWDLETYGGTCSEDGVKTVYITVKDRAGNVAVSSYQIYFDTTEPEVIEFIVASDATYTNSSIVVLTIIAEDASGSALEMRINNVNVWDDILWVPYDTDVEWALTNGDGLKAVYIQFRDSAGVVSQVVTDAIILDEESPSDVAVIIDSGAFYTENLTADISITASDATPLQYRLKNALDASWGEWISLAEVPLVIEGWLLYDEDGERTVCLEVRDYYNRTTSTTAVIIRDRTYPEDVSVTINNGNGYTNETSTSLNITASDATPLQYRLKNALDASWGEWISLAEVPLVIEGWLLYDEDGERTVCLEVRDYYNRTVSSFDTIVVDREKSVIFDTIIDSDELYTGSINVDIHVTGYDMTPTTLYLSNDNQTWEDQGIFDGDEIYNWNLIGVDDGLRRVYVRLIDSVDTIVYSYDDVILDQQMPNITVFSVNSNSTHCGLREVELTISALDTSPMDIQFSNDGITWSDWYSFTTTKTWLLSEGDGNKTVYCKVKDHFGRISTANDTIILDRVDPDGTINVNGEQKYTSDRSIILYLASSEAATMRIGIEIDSEITWGEAQAFTLLIDYLLPDSDGNFTLYYELTDLAGNVASPITVQIVLDREPIVVDTFVINDDIQYTSTKTVELCLLIADDITPLEDVQVRFSNDGVEYGEWLSFATGEYQWNLTTGDGLKTVWVELKDGPGHVTSNLRTITLIEGSPIINYILINEGEIFTNNRLVTITLDVENATEMRYSNDAQDWSNWENYAETKAWDILSGLYNEDGNKSVYIESRTASQITIQVVRYIILDRASANVDDVLIIDDDKIYGDGDNVTFLVDASESGLYVIVDFSSFDSGYQAGDVVITDLNNSQYQIFYTVSVLNSVPDGEYTIVIALWDPAGNEAYDESLRLELDNTQPNVDPLIINNGEQLTGLRTVILSIYAEDTHGMYMRFRNEDGDWSDYEPYATTKEWTLSEIVGIKTVYLEVVDVVGNVAGVKSDTIEFGYYITIFEIDYSVVSDHTDPMIVVVNATDGIITETGMGVLVYFSKNGIYFDYELSLTYNELNGLWSATINESYYEYGDVLYFYVNTTNEIGFVIDTNGGNLYTVSVVDQTMPNYQWVDCLNTTGELGEDCHLSLAAEDLDGSGVNIDKVTFFYSHDGTLWDTKHMRWNADLRLFEVTLQGSLFIELPTDTRIQYYVEIYDQDGNVAKTTLRMFDLVDTKAPTIVLPDFPATDADGMFTITFDVEDPSGITSIVVWQKYDNGTWQVANITSDGDSRSISCEFKNEITDYQKLYFFIEATDAEGNVGYLGKDGPEEEYDYARDAAFKVENDGYDPNPNTNTITTENSITSQNSDTGDGQGIDAVGLLSIVGVLGIIGLIGVSLVKVFNGQQPNAEKPLGEKANATDGSGTTPSDAPVNAETLGSNTETNATDLVFGDVSS